MKIPNLPQVIGIVLITATIPRLSYSNNQNISLVLDLNNSTHLSSCGDNGEWTVKDLNPVHDTRSYIPNNVQLLPTLTGLSSCGYDEAQCKVAKHRQQKNGKDDEISDVWYVKEYPTVYSNDNDERRFISNKNVLNGHPEYELQFIPIVDGIESEAEIVTIEKAFNESNSTVQFFDAKADGDFQEGKALCRISERRWGAALPDRCIITRFKTTSAHYVLGLVRQAPAFFYACTISARIDVGQLLSFKAINPDGFKNHLIGSLTEGDLQMDTNRIDVDGNTELGVTVYTSAGPRLSPINPRYREQVDVTLRFRPFGDGSLNAKGYLAAWISRQNTDPPGSWRMPQSGYYKELEKKLTKAVFNAFDAICKDNKKDSTSVESRFGTVRTCR